MKTEEGMCCGIRDIHLDSCNFFVGLGTLIVEGRTPAASERGYGEGPHCSYTGDKHRCNPRLPECQQYEGLVHHLQLLWKHGIPMSVQVLLYPECCQTNFGSCTMDTFPTPDIPYVLLEQWTIQVLPKRLSNATVNPQTLIQAMRSFLHFSQLSAWLSLSNGDSPNNVCYRICLPDEALSCKIGNDYTVHTFPIANISNCSVHVTVKVHPRQQHAPVICCKKHETQRILKCPLRISEEKESQSTNDSKDRHKLFVENKALSVVQEHSKSLSTNHHKNDLLNTSHENVSKRCVHHISTLKQKLTDCFIFLPITVLRKLHIHHRKNMQLNIKSQRHNCLEFPHSSIGKFSKYNGLSLHKQRCLKDIQKCQENETMFGLETVGPECRQRFMCNLRPIYEKKNLHTHHSTKVQKLEFEKNLEISFLPKTALRYNIQEHTPFIEENIRSSTDKLSRNKNNSNTVNTISLCKLKGPSQHLQSNSADIKDKERNKERSHGDTKVCSNVSNKTDIIFENRQLPEKLPMVQDGFSQLLQNEDLHKGHQEMQSKKFNKTIVLHPSSSIPLSYSPAPVRKSGTCFDFDSSLTSVSAIKGALFGKKWIGNGSYCNLLTSPYSNRLLGNFEETILNGRLGPVNVVDGFTAEIGASGSFCPSHEILPVTVFFYNLQDLEKIASPYLGYINLGEKGYRVPRDGTVQLTLFNTHGTVVKMFVVCYDLSDMPPHSQTFIRQRTLYMPTDATENDPDACKWLRYLIHLRFASTRSGKIYLHTDVRTVIRSKTDLDAATLHNQCRYELRSFTQVPENPKFSSRS